MKMNRQAFKWSILATGLIVGIPAVLSQDNGARVSSYMPVDIHESFATIKARMSAAKPEIMRRHIAVLEERYDLSNRPAQGITMSRGKPLQEGVRVKLPSGMTWEKLAALSPDEIKDRDLFPQGFLPLPHANHA